MGAEQSTGQIPQAVRETKEIFQQFQVQQEHAQTVSDRVYLINKNITPNK